MKDNVICMIWGNINITMLRVLVSLSGTQSFSRTAEQLRITQSAVSHAVRGFEAVIGVPLILRARKGATLTAAGENVLASAQRALEAIAQIGRLAETPVRGSVRLALTNSTSVKIAPSVLAAAAARYPALSIELLLGTDHEVAQWVAHGAADIGLSYDAGRCRKAALFDDELLVISSLKRPWARGPLSLRDLEGEPFIMSGAGCAPLLADLFAGAGMQPHVVLSANDMGALFALVGAGHGVSMVPELSFPGSWEKVVSRHSLQPRAIRPLWMVDARKPRNVAGIGVLKAMIIEAAAALNRGKSTSDKVAV